jgi:hypothetical protein
LHVCIELSDIQGIVGGRRLDLNVVLGRVRFGSIFILVVECDTPNARDVAMMDCFGNHVKGLVVRGNTKIVVLRTELIVNVVDE